MTKKKKFKRKLFVNKKLQILFSLYLMLGFIMATLFFSYEFIKTYFSFWGLEFQDHRILTFLNNPHLVHILLFIIFIALWYGISIVLTTNKFVGPLIRLNNILDDIKNGRVDFTFKFRKTDHIYKKTEQKLNEVLVALNEKKTKRNKLLAECENNLLHISKKLGGYQEKHQELIDTLTEIKHSIDECKKL